MISEVDAPPNDKNWKYDRYISMSILLEKLDGDM